MHKGQHLQRQTVMRGIPLSKSLLTLSLRGLLYARFSRHWTQSQQLCPTHQITWSCPPLKLSLVKCWCASPSFPEAFPPSPPALSRDTTIHSKKNFFLKIGSTTSKTAVIMKSSHIARRRRSENSLIILRLYKNGPPNEIKLFSNQNDERDGEINQKLLQANQIYIRKNFLFY